jgi:uncharacterized protein YegJ (DUF2314 family)
MIPWPRVWIPVFALAAWACAGCSKSESGAEDAGTPPPAALDIRRPEPYRSGDAELDAAMDAARASFPAFLAESMNNESSGTAFIAKVHAVTPQGAEDLWLSGVGEEGDAFGGAVESEPKTLTDLQVGQLVRFTLGEVVEWHYFQEDKVVGAQVTRVLRRRMTDAERAEHDVVYPFPFE